MPKNIYGQSAIADMLTIPQNSQALQAPFTDTRMTSFADYYANYFRAWNETPVFDAAAIKGLFIKRKPYYLENYAIVTDSLYQEFEANANLRNTGTVNQKAIVTHDTPLRLLPTNSILLEDPNTAGQGFPFDYLQMDFLNIGEPLVISHFSMDGKFALVLSTTGSSGYVCVQDVAIVADQFAQDFQNNLVMFYKNTTGHLIDDVIQATTYEVNMISILPLKSPGIILIPIRNQHGEAELASLRLAENSYIGAPFAFAEKNVAFMVDHLIGQPYGWGSTLHHMDCARLLRNYFAVFGIHLPLATKQQKFIGAAVNIADLSPEQKREQIIAQAIPYQSFIYFPGHIALYLGTYDSEPIIMHATWGVKLFDKHFSELRYVIGKSIISTFTPGKELLGFDADKSSLLAHAASFSNFKL